MGLHDVMRRALEDHDVVTCRRLWQHVAPNMPQPKSDEEAEITMHHACTQASNVRFKSRAYSHYWLQERCYPSGLPDYLKPRAERIYPKIVDGVGLAVLTSIPEIEKVVLGAMENVVLEHYADNNKDVPLIRKRLVEAKDKAIKKLVG